jgi:hypothetical protein
MRIITLNNGELNLIKKFKELPFLDKIHIAGIVSDLFKMLRSENRPSREKISEIGTWVLDPNALGDSTPTLAGEILSEQVESMNKESPRL